MVKIITLCGSTQFEKAFQEWIARLTAEGNIVLLGAPRREAEPTEEQKTFQEIYKRKIDLSDTIFVLNVGEYIDSRTRSEIEYARANKIGVRFLSEEYPGWTEN